MKGVDAGTLTVACLEQTETAEALIATIIGKDAGILEPGHYSKECLYFNHFFNILKIIETYNISFCRLLGDT